MKSEKLKRTDTAMHTIPSMKELKWLNYAFFQTWHFSSTFWALNDAWNVLEWIESGLDIWRGFFWQCFRLFWNEFRMWTFGKFEGSPVWVVFKKCSPSGLDVSFKSTWRRAERFLENDTIWFFFNVNFNLNLQIFQRFNWIASPFLDILQGIMENEGKGDGHAMFLKVFNQKGDLKEDS